jgi:hypothetical protein
MTTGDEVKLVKYRQTKSVETRVRFVPTRTLAEGKILVKIKNTDITDYWIDKDFLATEGFTKRTQRGKGR